MPFHSSRTPRGGRKFPQRRPQQTRRNTRKDTIHPSRFIKAAEVTKETASYEPTHTFSDFAVDTLLFTNIANRGITNPTPIQDQAIPLMLEGRDVIGLANTGTGKTLAFLLPTVQHLLTNAGSRALIIAPTRELAEQIEEECRYIAKGSGLHGAVLIGGVAIGPQLKDLKFQPEIIIGTPGRIKDHMERGSLELSKFSIVVLDEVDRMLDMGFVNDMRLILGKLPYQRQSLFFSATLDSSVRQLIQEFAQEPATVSVKTGDTSENVHQDVVRYTSKEDKIKKLHEALLIAPQQKSIIFDETQRSVERLAKELAERGFMVDAIHGGKSQAQRKRALDKFKSSHVQILVATDVAARGIDVSDITHVINYTVPQTYDDYTHRIGRAGRAGNTGYALTFVEN